MLKDSSGFQKQVGPGTAKSWYTTDCLKMAWQGSLTGSHETGYPPSQVKLFSLQGSQGNPLEMIREAVSLSKWHLLYQGLV